MKTLTLNGNPTTHRALAATCGVHRKTIFNHLKRGRSPEGIVVYYTRKRGTILSRRTSRLVEALESLGHWFNGGRMSFFRVGKLIEGAIK
jgi:hypothetical protein